MPYGTIREILKKNHNPVIMSAKKLLERAKCCKMSFQLNRLLILSLWLSLPFAANATHVVGGEMGYRCLGNNLYEVTLSVYRDCFNGASNAQFDDPVSIGVFDRDGVLIREMLIPFSQDDTLSTELLDECLIIPPDICVHTTTYRDTVTLGFLEGGYEIIYQRCCRNETINNIIEPGTTGATYSIKLTEFAMQNCNDSPVFSAWPPTVVCVQEPLIFNHSAQDINGDSLVYKLCTPFEGGSISIPRPQPPAAPPHDTIVWGPNFSAENMLGFGEALQIDPTTGVMTALPSIQGQYVVGVCVEEYDRATGELISVTRRDFQYNVKQCEEVVSAFAAPEMQCEELEVNFSNESDNTENFTWYFDYPNPIFRSDAEHPAFTYSDTGSYTIALIAEPNSVCADTFFQDIHLFTNTLTANFQADVFDCETDALIQLIDLSLDTTTTIEEWLWTITYGDGIIATSNMQDQTFVVPLGAEGTIQLTVVSANGCSQTVEQAFVTGLENPGALILDTLYACNGSTIGLNPNTPESISFQYFWNPTDNLDNPSAVNPMVEVNGDATYFVTITPESGACAITRQVEVFAIDQPDLNFSFDAECGDFTYTFVNESEITDNLIWSFGDPTNPDFTSNEMNPSYTFPDTGTFEVTLTIQGLEGCLNTVSQNIIIDDIALEAAIGVNYQNCGTLPLEVLFEDQSTNTSNNTSSWEWSLSDGTVLTDESAFTLTYSENQSFELTLNITTATGCSSSTTQTIDINIIEDVPYPDSLVLCEGSSESIQVNANPDYIYQWSPATGLSDPNSPNPEFSPDETTLYTLNILSLGTDTCVIEKEVLAIVTDVIALSVDGGIQTCEPITTLNATASSNTAITWQNESGEIVAEGTTFTAPVSGSTTYTVVAADGLGCAATESITVSGGPVNVSTLSNTSICLGEEITLELINLDGNDELTYTWSPEEAFEAGTANSPTPNYIEQPGAQTIYVEIANQFGCTQVDSFPAVVIDPAYSFGFTTELSCNGATVNFINNGPEGLSYLWDFGDNTTSTEFNPSHTYPDAGNYTVTLMYNYDISCQQSVSEVVDIEEPQIIADFSFDLLSCDANNATVQLFDQSINTLENTASWLWELSTGETFMDQNPIIPIPEGGMVTITLMITTENGCESTTTETLQLELINTNNISDLTTCAGGSVFLNPDGNPDYSYLWTPSIGLDDPTSPNPEATISENTIYTVQISTDDCALTQTIGVDIAEPINLIVGDDIATCGAPILLTASSNGEVEIIWESELEGPIGTGNSIEVNPTSVDTYTALATSDLGCTETASITVTNNGISVDFIDNATICGGEALELSVANLDPTDELSFNWTPLSNIIDGASTANPTVMVEEGTVIFNANISNQFDCTQDVAIAVSANNIAVELPQTVGICAGETVGLSPNADPDLQYEWTPGTGLDDPTSSNPIFIGSESTTYTVIVSSELNEQLCSESFEVTVDVAPAIDLQISGGGNQCDFSNSTLEAISSQGDLEYTWYSDPALNNPIGTGENIEVTPELASNTYFLVATGVNGCLDTASTTITVTEIQTGLSDLAVCSDTPTELNPGGNSNYEYNWDPDTGLEPADVPNPTISINSPITYTVTVTDPVSQCQTITSVDVDLHPSVELEASGAATLCQSEPVVLNASSSSNQTISWYDNIELQGEPIGTGTSIELTPPTGINTYVAVTENTAGCQDSSWVQVVVLDLGTEIPDELDACFDMPIELNPGGDTSLEYEWSPAIGLDDPTATNPILITTQDQIYTVTITSADLGCEAVTTIEVEVLPIVDISAAGDTLLCTSSPVELAASSTLGNEFLWDDDLDFNSPLGTGATILTTPQEDLIVYVQAIDDNGCASLDSVAIDLVPVIAEITPPVILCEPENDFELQVNNLDGTQALTYEWEPSAGIIAGMNDAVALVDPNVVELFQVVATNQYGCSQQLETTVVFSDLEESIDAFADPEELIYGASTTLTVITPPDVTVQWSPEETIADPTNKVTEATPNGSTTYVVAVDDGNCVETRSVEVNILNEFCGEPQIFLPNAFTPNGDGENDLLRVRGTYIEELKLSIYNRLGEKVFETQNRQIGWDGTVRGQPVTPDVFGFYMEITCPNGELYTKKGNITLLR